ncbi:MAG: hypothetical protein OXE47_05385 [Gammaproteobacteria bacterium]|nr:hypothetical protein [Gammaproteobacteria bacterium]MDD9852024.1 hypothetical protein [Gammaproteobacteria bacterium]
MKKSKQVSKTPADDSSRPLPHPGNFWESPTLEELTRIQGVKPIKDVRELFGTWPGEPDDGFEEMIDRLRHPERYQEEK